MKRTLGIGVVLTLVTAGLVSLSTRPRAPMSTTSIGDSSAQRVAPPEDEDERDSAEADEEQQPAPATPIVPPVITTPAGSAAVEQTTHGAKPGPALVASFDGLGVGFDGPQGSPNVRNPSDNTLAVGPHHIVQIVNSQTAIFTKKGGKFETTGRVLYGPVPTANCLQGIWRAVRGDQQRRCGRALRPDRQSLARRDAALPAWSSRGPISPRSGPRATRPI